MANNSYAKSNKKSNTALFISIAGIFLALILFGVIIAGLFLGWFTKKEEEPTEELPNVCEHAYGEEFTIGENGQKIYTCTVEDCSNTKEVALSGIAVKSPEYLVSNSGTVDLSDFTVTASYADETTYDVTNSEQLVKDASNAVVYQDCAVTFAYYGETAASEPLHVWNRAANAGSLTTIGFHSGVLLLGTLEGEFTYRFTVTELTKGSEDWDSWLIQFTAGTREAVLRSDAYVLDNFGRGDGASGTNGYTHTGAVIQSGSNIAFEVKRVYDAESGCFVLTVTATSETATSTSVITEPTDNDTTMSVYIGGKDNSYFYSDVIGDNVPPEETGITVSPQSVSVANGSLLDDVKEQLTVYKTYTFGKQELLSPDDYTLTCESYNGTEAGDYTAIVSYGGDTAEITVTVLAHEHSFADGKCSVCGMEGYTTNEYSYTDYLSSDTLTQGHKITITGTQKTTAASGTAENVDDSLIWSFFLYNGYPIIGRTDAYYMSQTQMVDSGITTTLNGSAMDFDDTAMKDAYLKLISDCSFTLCAEWTEQYTITVTLTMEDASGNVYVCEYKLDTNYDDSYNPQISLGGEDVTVVIESYQYE